MIQDILSSPLVYPGTMEFTAAAAPPLDVAVAPPPAEGLDCEDANGNTLIEPGDNLLLQRVWCSIPYGFGQGSGEVHLGIVFGTSTGAFTIPEFAGNSCLTVPDICHGIDFPGDGLPIKTPTGGGRLRWNLTAALLMRVSMVNLPPVLVGALVKVQFHFMILHTRPMVADTV